MDELVFVHLEGQKEVEINNYRINPEIPLPMLKQEFDKLVKDKEIPWPAFVRGIIYVFAKQPNYPHITEYKKLLYQFNPQIENLLLGEGSHLAETRQLDLARVIFQGLVNLNPELSEAWFNLGMCYQELSAQNFKSNVEQGQFFLNSAIETFESLVSQGKASANVYYNLGFLYRQNGRFAQAKEAWETAIELGVDEKRKVELTGLIVELDRLDIAETQFNSGVKAINNGKFREATILLQPLAKRYPNWWQVAFHLSVACFHMEENTKAKEILTKVAELHPDLPEVFYQLGLCYLKQDQTEQAVEAFYRARELAPENTIIQQVIAELPKEFQR